MTATRIMMVAILTGVVGRWANNKNAVPSAKGVVQVAAMLLIVAAMDAGKTQPIAQGLAWLFFAAVMLSDSSPLTGLSKFEGLSTATPVTPQTPVSLNPAKPTAR